jgi:hypothetical protein
VGLGELDLVTVGVGDFVGVTEARGVLVAVLDGVLVGVSLGVAV